MKLNTVARSAALSAGCVACALTLAGPAQALPPSPKVTAKHLVQVCPSPHPNNPQSCAGLLYTEVTTEGEEIEVAFTSDGGQCSDILVPIYIDNLLRERNRLSPGQTSTHTLSVSRGDHKIGVTAEGLEGGCNKGVLGSWEGDLRITRDIP
jgi:hypothetical protein